VYVLELSNCAELCETDSSLTEPETCTPLISIPGIRQFSYPERYDIPDNEPDADRLALNKHVEGHFTPPHVLSISAWNFSALLVNLYRPCAVSNTSPTPKPIVHKIYRLEVNGLRIASGSIKNTPRYTQIHMSTSSHIYIMIIKDYFLK
jgi:hypothetical protein